MQKNFNLTIELEEGYILEALWLFIIRPLAKIHE
jgi:hypothetical protein